MDRRCKLKRATKCLALKAIAAVIVGMSATNAMADDSVSILAGVRVWANKWDMPLGDTVVVIPDLGAPSPVLVEQGANQVSSTELTTIPFVGAKFGSWSVTLTTAMESRYSGSATSSAVTRSESDFAVGYSIVPNVTVSAAYKYAKVGRTLTDRAVALAGGAVNPSKMRAFLVGISGSVPISGDWGLYGNFAAGPNKIDVATVSQDISGGYRIGEFGFSKTVPASNTLGLKALVLTMGYRTQIIGLDDVPFSTYGLDAVGNPTSVTTRKGKQTSTTQGIVAGVVGVF